MKKLALLLLLLQGCTLAIDKNPYCGRFTMYQHLPICEDKELR